MVRQAVGVALLVGHQDQHVRRAPRGLRRAAEPEARDPRGGREAAGVRQQRAPVHSATPCTASVSASAVQARPRLTASPRGAPPTLWRLPPSTTTSPAPPSATTPRPRPL